MSIWGNVPIHLTLKDFKLLGYPFWPNSIMTPESD